MTAIRHLSILGSTGSIGRNTLEIAAMFPERFVVKALTAGHNVDLLARQIERFRPEMAAVYDDRTAAALSARLAPDAAVDILVGEAGYVQAATLGSSDTVVGAIVGAAGLMPTLAAVQCGKTVALANKETLVMAGEIVMGAARAAGSRIVPVDSEHSAVYQCLAGQSRDDLERILITASGGPFLNRDGATFKDVKPADALQHPNWRMGRKITIDSATLMNKGLEVIEAHHLFDVSLDRIAVLVHPQSIVHSMVAFRDGTVIAQLGVPDMKGAIAFALSGPDRLPINQPPPDFAAIGALHFRKPDFNRFPCLGLAFNAAERGGTLPAVMNAANEVAVNAFLSERLRFDRIPRVIETVMNRHSVVPRPTLEDILAADQWSRAVAAETI